MKSQDVKQAENQVQNNLARFDQSVDELINKIEDVGHSVHRVTDAVKAPIQKAKAITHDIKLKYEQDPTKFIVNAGVTALCLGALTLFVRGMGESSDV